MRLIAGAAAPMPIPEMKRPTRMGTSEVPNAIKTRPRTLTNTPPSTSFLAWPRSANGAMVICDKKPAMKPIPMMIPIQFSEMPYSSR